MNIAILQSCYIPWKGYFDIIASVDVFVVYDDVQYSKNHWHNRNLIKTQHGTQWLTIPVAKSDGAFVPIQDVSVRHPFANKHWQSIQQAYARAPHFARYRDRFADLFQHSGTVEKLSDINVLMLQAVSDELGLSTRFVWSRDLAAQGTRTDRLVDICRELGGTSYLSGPSARAYLEDSKFAAAGIELKWMDYGGYREYPQLHGSFEHAVTILDLLFNVGPDARAFMKSTVAA